MCNYNYEISFPIIPRCIFADIAVAVGYLYSRTFTTTSPSHDILRYVSFLDRVKYDPRSHLGSRQFPFQESTCHFDTCRSFLSIGLWHKPSDLCTSQNPIIFFHVSSTFSSLYKCA